MLESFSIRIPLAFETLPVTSTPPLDNALLPASAVYVNDGGTGSVDAVAPPDDIALPPSKTPLTAYTSDIPKVISLC